ncbi:MAG: hypothetical protein KDD51_03860 [Bdellovibrionales bacterium]|nr:hypothetical protein [Bdellovibrionales bacterium]
MEGFTKIRGSIWTWSRLSPEKGYDFNGTVLIAGENAVLIDPVPLEESQWEALTTTVNPFAILLTNRDHERAAFELAERAKAEVWIHEADADKLRGKAQQKFKNYDRLPLGIVPIHLGHLKSPGECAFYWKPESGDGVLTLGDALIGNPPGELNLLPPEKVPERKLALESIASLLRFDFTTLLVGDGKSFPIGGKEALEKYLNRMASA